MNVKYWVLKQKTGKPSLFFIHGLGGNSTAWTNIIKIMSKNGFSTTKIDLRGHGKSDKPLKKTYYSIDNMARDVYDIIKNEKLKNVVFVVHSFGGYVAYRYIARNYSEIKKVVLCNSPHTKPFKYSPSFLLRKFYWVMLPFIWVISKSIFYDNRNYEYPIYSDLKELSEFKLILKDISGMPFKVYLWNYMLLFKNNSDIEKISKMKIPFLLITSYEDSFLSYKSLEELSKMLKNSKLRIIKGCDHETILRKPKEVSEYILNFLKKTG